MLAVVFGVALIFFAVNQLSEVEPVPEGVVQFYHPHKAGPVLERDVVVEPFSQSRYQNIVRQAYDYSCGSAALTTLLNHHIGHQLNERQVMEGLIRFGDYQKIIERRGFSLLDMKRLAAVLGHKSGGFKGSVEDLKGLTQPAIVPIEYAGFKHFVVVKGFKDGRFFIADPSMGNISFTEPRFAEVWSQNVLFMIFTDGLRIKEELQIAESDLRYIDDQTLNLLSYRVMPHFSKKQEGDADRAATIIEYSFPDPADPENSVVTVTTSTRQRFKSK